MMKSLPTLKMRCASLTHDCYCGKSIFPDQEFLISNNCLYTFSLLQEEITEDDIDDSFKSMFAQLAGEVVPESYVLFIFF